MANLVKVDKNGSKHYEGYIPCDRCGGDGVYKWGAMISYGGGPAVPQYAGTCFKCNGSGKVFSKWIERTPEYQAKLDAKRAEKHAAAQAEWEAKQAEIKAQRLKEKAEREAAEAARKAISQHVGQVGEKLRIRVTVEKIATYEAPAYAGYGTELKRIYIMADENGNKLVWNTGAGLGSYTKDDNGNESGNENKVNLLKQATVLAVSGECNEREKADNLFDGNLETKWCDITDAPNFVVFDLGSEQTLTGWHIVNAGQEDASYITRTCLLQVRNSLTEEWKTVDMLDGNRNDEVSRELSNVSARYLRLYVVGPTQNPGHDATRIYELEVF